MTLAQLHRQAVKHWNDHGCSAHPYESFQKLYDFTANFRPKKILEIGTGMGFSAAVMALANPESKIETLEKDIEHIQAAEQFLSQPDLAAIKSNIQLVNESAEYYFESLQSSTYDLIFFDGFQIHYEFLPQYQRLLRTGGILFLGNNHLQSKTSKQFFEELEASGQWEILERFAETTIARKL